MLISGGICGLTGMIQSSAIERSLTFGISSGYGFTAIITAWLARLNAIAVLGVCILFAMLIQGGAYLQIAMNVSESVASLVQGSVLFFVLGSDFFIQYKVSLSGLFGRKQSAKGEVA
jgi:simple sugar transport system permease protein